MKGIVGSKEGAKATAGLVSLGPAILCELDAMIRNTLVDFAVL